MIADEKKNLRRLVIEAKNKMSIEEVKLRSILIFNLLEELPTFKKAEIILLYWSIDKEVHTHDFIAKWCDKKLILLPVIVGDDIILKQYTGIDKMVLDKVFGIPEPEGEEFADFDKIDLALIPGMAFDKKNYRLGRGKGFYDKFLPKIQAMKVGVCFNFQKFDVVPTDEYDVPMDLVIVEV